MGPAGRGSARRGRAAHAPHAVLRLGERVHQGAGDLRGAGAGHRRLEPAACVAGEALGQANPRAWHPQALDPATPCSGGAGCRPARRRPLPSVRAVTGSLLCMLCMLTTPLGLGPCSSHTTSVYETVSLTFRASLNSIDRLMVLLVSQLIELVLRREQVARGTWPGVGPSAVQRQGRRRQVAAPGRPGLWMRACPGAPCPRPNPLDSPTHQVEMLMPPKGASVICERRQESACWSRQAEDAGSARVPARQASATAARQPSYPGSRPPTQLRHFFLPGEAHRILARVGHAAARKLRGGVDGGVRDGGVGPRLEVLRDQAGCGTRDTRLRGGGAGAWQHQRAVQGRAQAGRASPARAARLTVGVAAARHAYTTWPAQFFLPLSTRVFSAPVQAAAAQPVAVHWLGAQPSQRWQSAVALPLEFVTSGCPAK